MNFKGISKEDSQVICGLEHQKIMDSATRKWERAVERARKLQRDADVALEQARLLARERYESLEREWYDANH